MPFVEQGGIRYYRLEALTFPEVQHGFMTRKGGVSPSPWASLNLGNTVGDQTERVQENLERVFQALGLPQETLHDVWQVHGNEVVRVVSPRDRTNPPPKADAMITDQRSIPLLMRFADCVPILFYDPGRSVVGIAHAGWKGTLRKVAQTTVEAMHREFGSRRQDIFAGIGPSIGPDHYQIGEDVIREVQKVFPERASSLLRSGEDGVKLDLWKANQLILEESGVKEIEVAGICTACHLEDWYSHRAERGQTGRFGAVIALKP